jgi:tetratricopeptide (TPR) repeat protein
LFEDGQYLFASDLRYLCLLVYLQQGEQAVREGAASWNRLPLLVSAVQAVRGDVPGVTLLARELQDTAVEQFHALGPNPPIEVLMPGLDLLRSVAGLGATPSLSRVLAQGLGALAHHFLDDRDYARLCGCLSEALSWDPGAQEFRLQLCELLLISAEAMDEMGKVAAARSHLKEFRQEIQLLAPEDSKVLDLVSQADALEAKLRAQVQSPVDEAFEVLKGALEEVDGDVMGETWRVQADLAEHCLGQAAFSSNDVTEALEYVSNAAYLAPRDPGTGKIVAPAHKRLIDL